MMMMMSVVNPGSNPAHSDERSVVPKWVRKPRRSRWRRPRWRAYSARLSNNLTNQGLTNHHFHHHYFQPRKTLPRVTGDQPLAPFNTNQFLMDDHDFRMPDDNNDVINRVLNNSSDNAYHTDSEMVSERASTTSPSKPLTGHRRRCNSDCTPTRNQSHECSSDEVNSLPDDEYDFMQQQFSETYEKINSERINSMSKSELVEEYLILERRCEDLESKLKAAENKLSKAAQS